MSDAKQLVSLGELGPCPVCGTPVTRPIAACSACHTAHHAECWSYNEGCAIYACGSRPAAPVAPVPPAASWRPDRFLARAGMLALVLAVFGIFALRAIVRPGRIDSMRVSPGISTSGITLSTPRRMRCEVEITRAGDFTPVAMRRTGRGRQHHVVVAGLEPGVTYVARAWTLGPFGRVGPMQARVFQVPALPASAVRPNAPPITLPEMAASAVTALPSTSARDTSGAPAVRDPFQFGTRPASMMMRASRPVFSATSASLPAVMPATRDYLANRGLPIRCAFAPQTESAVKSVPVRVEPRSGTFRGFEMKVSATDCQVSWRTERPVAFCRAVLSRDATLRGIEKVFDAQGRSSATHRVSLADLKPDTSYQLLILAFNSSADPVQSPVLAFRTLPK